jgi:hypothetical protein
MPDQISIIRLPDPELAPGYRNSLAEMSHFSVDDLGDGIAAVAPAEGPGVIRSYFSLIKLCDAETDLSDPTVWAPLSQHPPRKRTGIDPNVYREDMLRRGREIVERQPESIEAEIVAFVLAAFGAAESEDIPDLLSANLPALFEQFPGGSLFYLTMSNELLSRLTFVRAQLAFELTPDMPFGEDMEQLRALSDLSLAKGIDVSAVLNLPLIALSPSVLGFLVPVLPHVLVFCFGTGVDLQRPYPISFASLYRPKVLDVPEGIDRSAFLETEQPDDGVNLLEWWVRQLNKLYSYVADPTRFTDAAGFHDPMAQTAWMITFERLISDATSLLAEPQATGLDRVQVAFDLLDKAESMLGYERSQSGKGFATLLRRTVSLPALQQALAGLPGSLGERLSDEAEQLFAGLYSQVRANTVGFRLTNGGARVGRGSPKKLVAVDNDTLTAEVCRAVRNSSHGLLEMLREGNDRYLLAANTGGIPAELPALTPLIAIGLLADVEGLIDGGWKERLSRK